MDQKIEQLYDDRDRNENEPGHVGSTSPGVDRAPRGNPEIEGEDLRRAEEKLDRIVNW